MLIFKRSRLLSVITGIALVASGPVLTAQTYSQPTQSEDSDTDNENQQQPDIKKVSEAFGHFIGRNLSSPGIKFDLESIIKGMREGATGQPSPMADEDYEKAMAALQEKAFNYLADENLKAANAFLTKNAKAEGVIEIEPGKLQYTILEKGNGAAIQPHSTPLVNYTGKYIDGTVFGSSSEVGGPIPIPLDHTISGFSKGIVGMKEGEKRRLFVHPDLGYGKTGQLPPNSLLIFDVEAVKADSAEKPSPTSHASNQSSKQDDDSDEENDMGAGVKEK